MMKCDVKIVSYEPGNPDSEETASVEITKLIELSYANLTGAQVVKGLITMAFVKCEQENDIVSPASVGGNLGA